ncbi:MAG: D-glycero-D-manno-heptose 1,7-bisphosphate phosphatase [Alphaproteobacteria bacterium]|jgi:D-glycero-D-manno-heptose 1,7-bisphosphate phosphatase
MPYKAIIFDRDGTLNATSTGPGGYVLSPKDIKLLPHVQESLAQLKSKGVALYVFTQQRCINKGLLKVEVLNQIHDRLNALLGDAADIDAFYYCPHLADEGCDCSKPKPGMLFDCMKDHNLKPEEVLVVGDSVRDYDSAKAASLDFAFVPNDLGKHTAEEYAATGKALYKDLEKLIAGEF